MNVKQPHLILEFVVAYIPFEAGFCFVLQQHIKGKVIPGLN
jgi:hypothetical protein